MSKKAEADYWQAQIDQGKVAGDNMKEVLHTILEARKEASRQALHDEVEKVQQDVAANKAGSQQRIKVLNDEIAQMVAHKQTEMAEYKNLVKERDQAVQDASKKALKDEVVRVEESVKETKAGSQERIKILDDEIEKLKKDKQTETDEFKRLENQKRQAVLDLAKVGEKVEEEERKSKEQHEEALKNLTISRLELERKLGQISESQYEQQLRDAVNATYKAALEELEAKKRHYQQDPVEFAKVKAAIVKLNDKHNADIEKANQKSLLRQKADFDKYFKQISSSFTSEINNWIQGTETVSQAFSKMFQAMIMSLVNYLEQKAMKELAALIQSKIIQKLHATSAIMANAAVGASGAYADMTSLGPPGLAEAPGIAAGVFGEIVSFVGPADSSAGGQWIVPQDQLNFVHKNETILPASIAGGLRDMIEGGGGGAGGGGNTVHVHMNINAIDSASFKDTVGKHGHMIGELVNKALKKKGIK
jgi:hypothetical protein